MSSRAFDGPKLGTGALCQDGSRSRQTSRNPERRGQSGQSFDGSAAIGGGDSGGLTDPRLNTSCGRAEKGRAP
jgi:hypothetical protein